MSGLSTCWQSCGPLSSRQSLSGQDSVVESSWANRNQTACCLERGLHQTVDPPRGLCRKNTCSFYEYLYLWEHLIWFWSVLLNWWKMFTFHLVLASGFMHLSIRHISQRKVEDNLISILLLVWKEEKSTLSVLLCTVKRWNVWSFMGW